MRKAVLVAVATVLVVIGFGLGVEVVNPLFAFLGFVGLVLLVVGAFGEWQESGR